MLNGPIRGETPPPRDQQILEIRKQIEELNKKLDALSKPETKEEAKPKNTLTPGPEWLKPLTWRSIGPATMGGRIVAISVFEADPSTYWVATGGGGLLKTINNGITFEHQFDKEPVVAIGDVAVAPSNKDIVWVGTGENNPRNSVSYGDGVYKSTDGGKTWTNMGLTKTYQIGRIIIHPKNPDIVYVGALGRLFGPSEERGLYKTVDGGKTWQKILYVDDKTGIIELKMNPNDPETLLAATYERLRDLYDIGDPIKKWGDGSAIHKTTDGGKTFKKLTKGLPTVKLEADPERTVQGPQHRFRRDRDREDRHRASRKTGRAREPGDHGNRGRGERGGYFNRRRHDRTGLARRPRRQGWAPARRRHPVGRRQGPQNLFRSRRAPPRKEAGDVPRLKIERAGKPVEASVTLVARAAQPAGTVPAEPAHTGQGIEPRVAFEDRRACSPPTSPSGPFGLRWAARSKLAQGPPGEATDGFQTGGVFKSTDGGESWTRVNSLNPRPFYFSQVRVDPSDDKRVYVLGIDLHPSADGGKTFRGDLGRGIHADFHAMWIDPNDGRHILMGCDGGTYVSYDRASNWDHLNQNAISQFYHVAIDARRPYKVYGGLQDNGSWGSLEAPAAREGADQRGLVQPRRRRRFQVPGRPDRRRPDLLNQPVRRPGPAQPANARERADQPRPRRERSTGSTGTPRFPLQPQPQDLLRRG